LTTQFACVVFGLVGGLGGEVITLYDRTTTPRAKQLALGWGHWICAAVLVVLGGFLAYAYRSGDSHLSLFLAIQIGLSTPVILRRGRRALPDIPPGSIG
jgi:hypothetical protein